MNRARRILVADLGNAQSGMGGGLTPSLAQRHLAALALDLSATEMRRFSDLIGKDNPLPSHIAAIVYRHITALGEITDAIAAAGEGAKVIPFPARD